MAEEELNEENLDVQEEQQGNTELPPSKPKRNLQLPILIGGVSVLVFIIFGGLGDKNNAKQIISNVNNNIISLVDKTSIMQCAAIISRCNLYLGNDCGLMHIASMMGLKCIALFSIHQRKGVWEPFGDENIIIRIMAIMMR